MNPGLMKPDMKNNSGKQGKEVRYERKEIENILHRDNEIVDKVKSMKSHFLSKKKKVEELKKTDAINHLKIDMLVKRIKDIEYKK